MTGWRPLSQRGNSDEAPKVLYEGVPGHLRNPLLHWLQGQFCHPEIIKAAGDSLYQTHPIYERENKLLSVAQDSDARALRIANRARLSLTEISRPDKKAGPLSTVKSLVELAEQIDDVQFLDIIDAALAECSDPRIKKRQKNRDRWREVNTPEDLESILHYGGSAYRVNDCGDALEQRVPAVIRQAVRYAADNSTNSLAHLDAAWQAAYGMKPNATVAYAEAVKAIESAVIPAVLPNNSLATLGKALGQLRAHADHWELGISNNQGAPAEIDPLISFIDLMWQGHRDRHGGPATVPVTSEAAEMAVHAAAMIAYWFSRGGLRRRGQ